MTFSRTDTEAAHAKMRRGVGAKKPLKEIEQRLWEDESVRLVAGGAYEKQAGIVVLTSHRILFAASMLGTRKSDEFRLEEVTNIDYSATFMSGTLSVATAGGRATMDRMHRGEGQAFADAARVAARDARSNTTPGTDESVSSKLIELKKLLDAGILSPSEYSQKTEPLIARL